MKEEEISRLLAKFYEGESTEEDEQLLRALFSDNIYPEGFEAEGEYIRFCMKNGYLAEPSGNLTDKILTALDEPDRLSIPSPGRNKYLIYISSIAAAFLIFLGTYFYLESRNGLRDTYSDPEIAYAETIKILKDVSYRLNKGTSKLSPVGKLSVITEKSMEKIAESTSLMNRSFSKVNNIVKTASLESKADTGLINK